MGRQTRILAEGLYFGEGPRWRDGRLWFSDFHAHAVKSVSLAGDVRTEVELNDQPSALGVHHHVVTVAGGDPGEVGVHRQRAVAAADQQLAPDHRHDQQGAVRHPAQARGLVVQLHFRPHVAGHCNDMVVDAQGRAYVGNFGFDFGARIAAHGMQGAMVDAPTAKLALVLPDGEVRAAAEGLHFPNGSVITPDGSTLIVAETLASCLTAFDIGPDGDLSNRRVWAPTPGAPDGIALDAAGAIWVASPGGQGCVRIAEGGEVLEAIDPGQACYACILGGDDGRTLFMLTAPPMGENPAAAPLGKVSVATVDVPHAGLP